MTDVLADRWELVTRAQAGDRDAVAQLYERYHETVSRFVQYRVGHRQVAEDITSDTFVRALGSLSRVTWQGHDFGAWLVTIARNLIADYYKSGRYRLEVFTGEMAADVDRRTGADTEQVVLDLATRRALLDAIEQLATPAQREVIRLRFFAGLSTTETARAMGMHNEACKALQYRACQSLRRLLVKAGVER